MMSKTVYLTCAIFSNGFGGRETDPHSPPLKDVLCGMLTGQSYKHATTEGRSTTRGTGHIVPEIKILV